MGTSRRTTKCTHTFQVPEYDEVDVDRNKARASWLLGPDDIGVEDGVWTCPHETVDEKDKCVFHLSPSDRPAGVDITQAFLDAVEQANRLETPDERRRHRQFIDATFDEFDLRATTVGGTQRGYIDCRHARFGRVDCEHAEFEQRIRFSSATFGEQFDTERESNDDSSREVIFRRTIFRYSVGFSGATFGTPVNFTGARFRDWAGFRWATFHDDANFEWTTFQDMISARDVHFRDRAKFRAVSFDGWGQFNNAVFEGPTIFDLSNFGDDADFVNAQFHDDTTFAETEFSRQFNLSDAVITAPFSLTEGRVDRSIVLSGATLRGTVRLDNCSVSQHVEAERVRIESPLFFDGAQISTLVVEPAATSDRTDPAYLSLVRSTVTDGVLRQPPTGTIVYDLAFATVGDVVFSGTPDGSLFEYIRFFRTRFDGFDFSASDDLDLASAGYVIHTLSDDAAAVVPQISRRDPSIDDLWTTYLYAKTGAERAGDNTAAGLFFYREMVNRRRAHFDRALNNDGRSITNRIIDVTKWGRSCVLGGLTGYGEKPDRVIYASIGVIAAFTPLYALTLTPRTGESPASVWEILTLSLQSYVTFLLGQPPGDLTLIGEVLSAFEGFIGAFLVALFVFTLTRRIHR
ncbi:MULTISPECIES: pentapeptide repeat-containing protein [Haloferax]|uniref:Pentapeptide repeat-containing protein n=1 Tax=Haloferax marinum TaxID=2666143 RepID=A0A6A8G5E7_9EURY|nr:MULTISPECIES: pentapeptide repeat-containing protein [Haloferax]KAB1196354.1 pentapeptide repeat-containing protein [Haloferax sp. CBA1150]MRW95346.1 hypothetical protein [Haloferax marinum]